MKYIEKGDILISDFDGVYLDSQARFQEVMQEEKSPDLWSKYLKSINWPVFLRECKESEGATEMYLELQELKIFRAFLTRIHSLEEAVAKAEYIRERGLYVPICYVFPNQAKSIVYPPDKHTILLEDKLEEAFDWEFNGGKAILYNPEYESNGKTLIKKMSDLLTK